MRVVLDTNILVSAVLGGVLHIIVDEWKARKFTLIVSEAVVREYLDVINRPKLGLSGREVAAVTDYLLKIAEFVTPAEPVHVIEADPSDNKFLEAAIEGKAVYVVSGDSHLLQLKEFRGVSIVSAREFIEHLAEASKDNS